MLEAPPRQAAVREQAASVQTGFHLLATGSSTAAFPSCLIPSQQMGPRRNDHTGKPRHRGQGAGGAARGLCHAVWCVRGVHLSMKETINGCGFVSGAKLHLPDSLLGRQRAGKDAHCPGWGKCEKKSRLPQCTLPPMCG